MATPSKTPQDNFQDNQNFDIDIKQMFQDFISGTTGNTDNVAIDDLRSQINMSITQQTGAKLFASLNIDGTSTSGTSNTTTPGSLVQESRCHTFYRIIGFPVVDSTGNNFYNPGFDIVKQTDTNGTPIVRRIGLSDKIKIASDPLPDFEKLSFAREQYVVNNLKTFSTQGIDASCLALTSGTYGVNSSVNIRPFSAPFNAGGSLFDMKVVDQSYSLNQGGLYSLVGNQEVLLSEFQDANGNTPNQGLLGLHSHIIQPFLVDPRIDFSVYPIDSGTLGGVAKRIAVPFVPDKTFLKVSATAYAQRPLLEKIIREKFAQNQNVGTANQSVIDYIKSVKSIQDSSLVSQVNSSNIYSQQNSFAQYLSIIQSMMVKLVEALKAVHAAQGLYYYLPVPSTTGPEAGSNTQPVIINSNLPSYLLPTNDLNIIYKAAQSTINNLTGAGVTDNSTPDVGGYAFSAYKLTFGTDTSASYGDNSNESLDDLNKIRDQVLGKANDGLQVIEMIMGEFSGFGLCDIIAILGALYLMSFDDLIEFLDSDSINRMNQAFGTNLDNTGNLKGSLQKLADNVNGYYNIMDQIFLDTLNNNASNV